MRFLKEPTSKIFAAPKFTSSIGAHNRDGETKNLTSHLYEPKA
jgi:hypothetical protein